MKKILWIFSSALLLSVGFFSTGCGDDETKLDPSVVITDEPDASDYAVGDVISFTVTATKGTDPLKAITFYQNGEKVAVEDLKIDGTTPGDAAILITDPKDEMEWNVDITLSATGDYDFSVKVEDTGGLTATANFIETITVGTPIDELIEGATIQLWNQAGPAGRGAIDLDNGTSTGTSASGGGLEAELRDMGIDSAEVNPDIEWRQRIGGINGTEVKYVGNVNTDSDFAGVVSKEAIVAAFDNGEDFVAANTLTEGGIAVWGNFKVSKKVEQGDIFAVYKSSPERYYLVVVENIVVETDADNNNDYYLVSIKY